jgi:hypothetical protein
MLGNYRVSAQLVASQVALNPTELVDIILQLIPKDSQVGSFSSGFLIKNVHILIFPHPIICPVHLPHFYYTSSAR